MKWVLLSYLILNPMFYLVNFDQRDVQQIFFQISSVIVFAIGMFFHNKEVKLSKLNIAIGVMLMAFVLAWLRTKSGWPIAQNFLFGTLVYLTVIRTLKKEDILFIFKGMGYFSAFCVVVLAFQLIGWDYRGARLASNFKICPTESVFFQRSAMGMFFAQSIPMILSYSWTGLFLLLPMYQSLSTAAYLGAVAGMLFFYWFRKRIVFWVLIPTIIILCIFSMTKDSVRTEAMKGLKIRIPMWGLVIQDIFKNPLGYGLDSFANPQEGGWRYYNFIGKHNTCIKGIKKGEHIDAYYEKDIEDIEKIMKDNSQAILAEHPHNEYVWLGYEVGIHAWVILGFIFYFIWDRFRKSKRDVLTCASMAVLVCLAMESILQFPFHLSRVGVVLPFILGVFYISTEE